MAVNLADGFLFVSILIVGPPLMLPYPVSFAIIMAGMEGRGSERLGS